MRKLDSGPRKIENSLRNEPPPYPGPGPGRNLSPRRKFSINLVVGAEPSERGCSVVHRAEIDGMNPRGGIGCARPEVQGEGGGAAPSLREERGRVLVLNTAVLG